MLDEFPVSSWDASLYFAGPLLFKDVSGDKGLRNAVKTYWNLKSWSLSVSGTSPFLSPASGTYGDTTWFPQNRARPETYLLGDTDANPFPYKKVLFGHRMENSVITAFGFLEIVLFKDWPLTGGGRYGLTTALYPDIGLPYGPGFAYKPIIESTNTIEGNAWYHADPTFSCTLNLTFWDYP